MSDPLVARLRAAGCVFAEDEARVLRDSAADPDELERLLQRREAGEPLEHVVGWAEVDGVRVAVRSGVFVPRRRTALLARTVVELVPPGGVVVDVCCGAGVVAALVATRRPDVTVHACDADPDAVACARRTLGPLGATVHAGDLLDALPEDLRGRVDVVAANAPYVPTHALQEMPREAREHERRAALDGGVDGAQVHRRVAQEAMSWLTPDGAVVVETGGATTAATLTAITSAGFDVRLSHDPALSARVAIGTR